MKLRLAILDLYNGTPNQGMRCIHEIISRFKGQFEVNVYSVRDKGELPNLDHDIFISTGGPGNPLDGNGVWDVQYYDLIDQIWEHNLTEYPKKHAFFICHSFQMVCHHFGLGSIVPRKSMSFGTYPVHQTDAGILDPIFAGLDNPFWAADFRRWQFIEPDKERFAELNAEILALEKIRPHVPLERAIMAVRISEQMVGVQFHPEADSAGMVKHFEEDERMVEIIEKHGEAKFKGMIKDLKDANKIAKTNNTILPNFLRQAIAALSSVELLETN